ncbi:MAG TPA: class I SAM-dependent methyltransferase [Xanthobacteraceae bacterium]|nr:class I SAM-dependent methyltransferase [Xanthobacteraceae bacterium]
MTHDRADDVPSPIDLRAMDDAREWAATVMSKRPWREQFFQQFIHELRGLDGSPLRILELGSGPGFLAQRILRAIPSVEYTMLDFSQAMHELARERLGPLMQHARPIVVDFKQDRWSEGLGRFNAVVTMQAVHELRHKKHAHALHRSVRSLLSPRGHYLVCDHYAGGDGMANTALFMTVAEQRDCLEAAGFGTVTNVLETHGLVLHRAMQPN